MPGRCGRCGKYVGAAEERRALGKSWHVECYTCAICHRGLDSMTIAEHGELKDIFCKACYRLYIGPDGYGYPPNGPALIAYDMERQGPPPGSGGKWKTPPTRLGKTFLRKKTLPNKGSAVSVRSAAHSATSKTSSHFPIRRDSPRPPMDITSGNSMIPLPPPLPPPPPPFMGKSRSQNSNFSKISQNSNVSKSSGKTSGNPPPPPPPPPPLPPWSPSPFVNKSSPTSSHRGGTSSPKIPKPPPLPPPPPPPKSGKLSQVKIPSEAPSLKKSQSGHYQNLVGESSTSRRSRSSSPPVKSQQFQYHQQPGRDPNCPPLFFCGGKCIGTPSVPRYPPNPSMDKRIPLGPSFGAVRGVPKGIGERCRRCGRPVFQAELQLGYHGAYHTECFKCCSCGKKLDSTTVAEHQGEIFCKGCYRRNFATSGVGFGIGAGALQTP